MHTGVDTYKKGVFAKCLQSLRFTRILSDILTAISKYDPLETALAQLSHNCTKNFLPIQPLLLSHIGSTDEDSLRNAIYETPSKLPLLTPGRTHRPKHIATEKLFSLQTIYQICAYQEVCKQVSTLGTRASMLQILEANKAMARKHTAAGVSAKEECQRAIDFVKQSFVDSFPNYSALIPRGSHIAYEFGGNKLHHAVYLGSNIVIEMRNFQTKQGICSSINLTYLHDFFKRVRNSGSPLYHFLYDSPYDPETIVQRAIQSLGTIQYNVHTSNCESCIQWILTDRYESSMCFVPYKGTLARSQSQYK